MGDVDNGAGQADNAPEPQTPGTPDVAPEGSGQATEGQGDGQGAGAPYPAEVHPAVTKAQQAAAEARQQAEALSQRLAELESRNQAPTDVDPERAASLKAFDSYAKESAVIKQQQAVARNTQAQLIDTKLSAKYGPQYESIRQNVMKDVGQLDLIPAENFGDVIDRMYKMHAYDATAQTASAKDAQIASLQQQLDSIRGNAQKAGVDIGSLQAAGGTAGTKANVEVPGENATPAELAAYIDQMNAERGLS